MNGNHCLIKAVPGSQQAKLFEFIDPASGDANLLPWQSNVRSNLTGSKRQSLQPSGGVTGKLVRADNQQASRLRQVRLASVKNAERRMQENGKDQKGDKVTHEQGSGENIVPAEKQRGQQDERRSDAGGPCSPCSGPLPKEFIETCHSIV